MKESNKRLFILILAVIFTAAIAAFSVYDSLSVSKQNIHRANDLEDAEKIDINTASNDELLSLPGIEDKLCRRIISYREAGGRFDSIEDIKMIYGIGDKIFDDIQAYITVEKIDTDS